MKLFGQWLSFLIFTLASVAVSQQPDVSGIQMGMSLEQAKAKIGTGYSFTPEKLNDPMIEILVAQKATEGWILEAIGGKLVYLRHDVFFPQANRPNSQDTLRRLIQKYGPIPLHNGDAAWAFSSSGAPLPQDRANACGDTWMTNSVGLPGQGPIYFRGVSVPGNIPANCGISIEAGGAGADPDSPGILMDKFIIYMVDLKAQYDEQRRFSQVQQKQHNDIMDKAKQNKVPF